MPLPAHMVMELLNSVGGGDHAWFPVVFKLLGPRQIHQPWFASADPEFIAWYEVARRKIKSAQHHLGLTIPQ
jgi:hypothetical protein